MKKFIGVLFSSLILFSACSESGSEEGTSTADEPVKQEAPAATETAPPPPPPTPATDAAEPTLTPVEVADGINPAHGQPGHDCSVAVGAPLPQK